MSDDEKHGESVQIETYIEQKNDVCMHGTGNEDTDIENGGDLPLNHADALVDEEKGSDFSEGKGIYDATLENGGSFDQAADQGRSEHEDIVDKPLLQEKVLDPSEEEKIVFPSIPPPDIPPLPPTLPPLQSIEEESARHVPDQEIENVDLAAEAGLDASEENTGIFETSGTDRTPEVSGVLQDEGEHVASLKDGPSEGDKMEETGSSRSVTEPIEADQVFSEESPGRNNTNGDSESAIVDGDTFETQIRAVAEEAHSKEDTPCAAEESEKMVPEAHTGIIAYSSSNVIATEPEGGTKEASEEALPQSPSSILPANHEAAGAEQTLQREEQTEEQREEQTEEQREEKREVQRREQREEKREEQTEEQREEVPSDTMSHIIAPVPTTVAPKQEKRTKSTPLKKKRKKKASRRPPPSSTKPPTPPQPPKVKYDRYGYKIVEGEVLTEEELRLRRLEKIKESEREMKWILMIRDWKAFSSKKWAKIEERVIKGIPDSVRSKAWVYLIDPEGAMNRESDRPSVQSFIDKGRLPCCDTIDVDLNRTMPQVELFSKKDILESLRNVLHAYSNADPDLGYTQGMAFHAAMLLNYMDETQAFWCFNNLMRDPRYGFREYFISGFPRLYELTTVWDLILSQQYKRIHARLNDFDLTPIFYTPKWFLCAFMNMAFPPVVRLMIYDRYITFGSRALLSFALVIISRHKSELMTLSHEELITLLTRPDESPKMSDWRYIILKWNEKWITERQYKAYFKKAKIALFP